MKVAIHQPNYIPWLGFFHKMMNADIFVLLDDVKHSKSSVTHRNKIKAHDRELLLTVPLKNKESLINELIIHNPAVNLTKHWQIIKHNYKKAKYWDFLSNDLSNIYESEWRFLVDLNISIINLLRDKLQIQTEIIRSSNLENLFGEASERNLNICKKLNANVYLSGLGARKYNDEISFRENDIKIEYNNFQHPVYTQIGDHFIPNLSIIDLLFNCGKEGRNIIRNLG